MSTLPRAGAQGSATGWEDYRDCHDNKEVYCRTAPELSPYICIVRYVTYSQGGVLHTPSPRTALAPPTQDHRITTAALIESHVCAGNLAADNGLDSQYGSVPRIKLYAWHRCISKTSGWWKNCDRTNHRYHRQLVGQCVGSPLWHKALAEMRCGACISAGVASVVLCSWMCAVQKQRSRPIH